MSEAPGIEIPTDVVIDALRNELAVANDERTTLRIKVMYQNEYIAALQAQLEAMTGHTHDGDAPKDDDILAVSVDDTGVQVISGDDVSE